MSICKECLHNEVCKYGENRSNGMYCTGDKCKQYKPTADVVEVVRCKDCKYLKYGYQCYRPLGMNLSNNEDAYVLLDTENDYCSCGERREG